MSKNTTLLLAWHEVENLGKPIYRCISPLFQLNAYATNLNQSLDKITNNPKFNYQPRKKYFDRILIITSNQQSIARRSAFINTKREPILQYFNNHGKSSTIYTIFLNQINKFVPQDYLVNQIDLVINNKIEKIQKLKQDEKDPNKIIYFKRKLVDQFSIYEWKQFLKLTFPRHSTINHFLLENSYFSIQISNIYMIKFARNPQSMYLDMKDLDAYLTKFNFIRYFYQLSQNNDFMAQKYCERFIKKLKFRTDQTQQYLLMLIRSVNWEKFLIYIQDFCICYQTLEPNHIHSQQKQRNQNTQNIVQA